LGVGETSPDTKIYIKGSETALLSNQTSTYAPSVNAATTSVKLLNDSSTTGAYASLEFWTRNAVSNVNIAYIASPSTSSNDTGTLVFGRRTGSASSAESMRLDSSGNFGIGTSSPARKLNVAVAYSSGTIVPAIKIATVGGYDGNSGTGIDFGQDQGTYSTWVTGRIASPRTGNNWGGSLTFSTNNNTSEADLVERMRIDSAGNLGLGVAPSAWTSSFGIKGFNISNGALYGANNDMSVLFNSYFDGTNFIYIAATSTVATKYTQGASGQHQWFNAAAGTAGNPISFTQAMTLDSSGNLGIGTTSPAAKLEIKADNNEKLILNATLDTNNYLNQITFQNAGTTYAAIIAGKNASNVSVGLVFNTGTTEKMRLDSSGNLSVGDTAVPLSGKFGVIASGSVNTAVFKVGISSTYAIIKTWDTATTGNSIFASFSTDSNSERGSIEYNRSSGLVVYATTSDYRAKDIIGPILDSGALIDSTPVYRGKMKGATQERPMFIAHETPEYCYMGEKDAVDADGKPVYQKMDASALIPVMWAELQSLRARVAQLESKP
jgi:hypothetical protein